MLGEWSLEEGVRSCYWATMGGIVEESSETVRFDVCFGDGALHCIAGCCRLGVRLWWKYTCVERMYLGGLERGSVLDPGSW